MGSEYGSQGDKGQCGYRWGKMMGRCWCTSTKSGTCGWDMLMVGAERSGRMRRRVRDKRETGAGAHGTEGGAKAGGTVDADAVGCAGSGVSGQHKQNSGGVGAHKAGLGPGVAL